MFKGKSKRIRTCNNMEKEMNNMGIIITYIIDNYDVKEVDLDTFFGYVEKYDFNLKDIGEGKHDVIFFENKNEWICWCCGNIRVIIDGKIVCIPGIWYKEGIFAPKNKECDYFCNGECTKNKCVRQSRLVKE